MTAVDARVLVLPYQHLLFQDISFVRDEMSGAVTSKLKAIRTSFRSLREDFIWNITGLAIGFVVGFFILLTVPLPFMFLFLGWVMLAAGCGFWAVKRIKNIAADRAEIDAEVSGIVGDSLTNIHAVKAQAFEVEEYQHFSQKVESYSRKTIEYHKVWYVLHSMQEFSFQLMIVALVALVLWLWPQDVLTLGQIAMLIPLFFDLVDRMWRMVASATEVVDNYTTIHNALKTIYQPYIVIDCPSAQKLKISGGAVEMKRVSFQYAKDDPWLFKDLSLHITPGQKVGLVGHSGAGKSTLMSLLLRFYDVQKGRIEVDGQNIANVTQSSLRRSMVMVPQDTALFNRSILDNIRYGRPEATEAEVMEAAKKAHAHSFIEKLPKDYDSKVGERGVKLSGGQRQRIAIARAFLSAPKIVLLDEATSALDSESELAIQKSLSTLMKGRTVIAIAHRLSTLRQMDRILVMDEGRVVEDGTHAHLLKKKNGVYARLWQLQKDGFLPEQMN